MSKDSSKSSVGNKFNYEEVVQNTYQTVFPESQFKIKENNLPDHLLRATRT